MFTFLFSSFIVIGRERVPPSQAMLSRFALAGVLAAAIDSSLANKGFTYASIAGHLLKPPYHAGPDDCQKTCHEDEHCAAWEVCAPLGNGCDGCYLVSRSPPGGVVDSNGWHAEVVRPELERLTGPMTTTQCRDFLLNAHGGMPDANFHEPENMQRYTECMMQLRMDTNDTKSLYVAGHHYPTTIVVNYREPSVTIPQDIEDEMRSQSGRHAPFDEPPPQPMILDELHASTGTQAFRPSMKDAPHTFIVPFYDTNIGHWIKQTGTMNIMQSYEMQTIVNKGDTVIDAGANLGCYSVALGAKVGPKGKILSFEPFRWMSQLLSANIAVNGLSNVWVFPVALGTESWTGLRVKPPQLRFFSSPGGVRINGQMNGLSDSEMAQLYDWDTEDEEVTVMRLDDIIFPTVFASFFVDFAQNMRKFT